MVEWKDFGHEHNTWEPESSFDHCRADLERYWGAVKNPIPAAKDVGVVNRSKLEQAARRSRKGSKRSNQCKKRRVNNINWALGGRVEGLYVDAWAAAPWHWGPCTSSVLPAEML